MHISSFVQEGGVLCISTANGVSYLSETLRRLFRDRFFDATGDVHVQARKVLPFLQPHLDNLRGMSRPTEDWILDNIVQPLQDRCLLSIPEVISCLNDTYDVYGSSPRFLTDWRWYKDLVLQTQKFNELALENYYQNNLNLLDYRFQFSKHTVAFGEKLEELGAKSWDLMCKIEQGSAGVWSELFDLMEELCIHIEMQAPTTVEAIREAVILLKSADPNMKLKQFPQWWGRGQQYLSLIKKNI
jgi:hypothetical protein